MLPLPWDAVELERMVARYARLGLGDHHAQLRGRTGQRQHGIDVLAKERRGGQTIWWAFQAKHMKTFTKANLTKELKRLEEFDGKVDHYVVVTTAPPSTAVQDHARNLCGARGFEIAIWGWEDFAARFRDACGSDAWLSTSERARRRGEWIDAVRSEAANRSALDPLLMPRGSTIAVEDVWIEPELHATDPSLSTNRREWFRDTGPDAPARLVPLVGAAGAGKTSLLWHFAAERAAEAAEDADAPLPVVVTAQNLVLRGAAAVAAAMSSTEPGQLWADQGTDWLVLVDGFDEVAEPARTRASHEVRLLLKVKTVVGVAVACRDSHLTPGLFGAPGALVVLPWAPSMAEGFAQRWADATGRPAGERGHRSVYALEAALSAAYGVPSDQPGAPWIARQRMLHAALVDWPRGRDSTASEPNRQAIECLALEAARRGGRLTRAERAGLGLAAHEAWLETEGRRSGVFGVDADGLLVFTHQHVTEALAAGELARQPPAAIARAAEFAPLSTIAHLAALGCVLADLTLLRVLVSAATRANGGMIAALRRVRWHIRVVDDLGSLGGEHIDTAAEALIMVAANETWSWIREAAAPWLVDVATRGGPLWEATWSRLEVSLGAGASRGACLQGYADKAREDSTLPSDPGFWIAFLYEEDAWVRAVATQELATAPEFEEKERFLVMALLDHGHAPFAAAHAAITAGLALRLREINRPDLVGQLRGLLRCGRQFPAGAAALALRPGEAPVEDVLRALRDLDTAAHPPQLAAAVAEVATLPGAEEWMAAHWPSGPQPGHESSPISAPYLGELPPSDRVRQILVSSLAGGFARGGRWADAPEFIRRDGAFLAGMSRATRTRPDEVGPVVLALVREAATWRSPPFLTPDAQVDLGEAAARDPELVSALARWWDSPTLQVRSSFPGIALEALAAEGHAEAARVYSAWLPSAPFMLLLSSWWRPPSSAVLAAPAVLAAARDHCLQAWAWATEGRVNANGERSSLAAEAVGHLLRGLWPAWAATEIPQGLVTRALDPADPRWFRSSLEAFIPSGLPLPLADALLDRLAAWPTLGTWEVDYYVAIASRTGLTPRAREAFWEMLNHGRNSGMWSAAAGLAARADSPDARAAAERAATLFPAYFSSRQISEEQVASLVRAAPESWLTAVERSISENGFWEAAENVAVLRGLVEVAPRELRERIARALDTVRQGFQAWVPTAGTAVFRPDDAALDLLFRISEDW